jgi:predicted outer membrane repeat protein
LPRRSVCAPGSNTATSYGGGIYIQAAATVYIDAFTVANIVNNTDRSGPNGPTANIDGSYIPI